MIGGPVASVATCPTFWSAKASQPVMAPGRSGSSSTSWGTCSSEVDVATATWGESARSSVSTPNAASRSPRQVLWPSTTQPTRVLAGAGH